MTEKTVMRLGAYVDQFIRQRGDPAKVPVEKLYKHLLELGVTPCVARDWANEPARRIALERRKEKCRNRKRGWVVQSFIRDGRHYILRATKGWISYRVPS